jgi:hypothetical protein
MEKITPTSIKIPKDLKEKLVKKAKANQRTLHGYIIHKLTILSK